MYKFLPANHPLKKVEKIICYHARSFIQTNTANYEDLLMIGWEAAMESMKSWDETKGRTLENWASIFIRSRMIDKLFKHKKYLRDKEYKRDMYENPDLYYQPPITPYQSMIQEEKSEDPRYTKLKQLMSADTKMLKKNNRRNETMWWDHFFKNHTYKELQEKYGLCHKQIDNTFRRIQQYLRQNGLVVVVGNYKACGLTRTGETIKEYRKETDAINREKNREKTRAYQRQRYKRLHR